MSGKWSMLTVVLLCAAGNYLIRVLPWFMTRWERVPLAVRRFLTILPISALGALIFPGALTALADTGRPWAALGGLGAAAATAGLSKNLILPVAAAVLVTWVLLQIPLPSGL